MLKSYLNLKQADYEKSSYFTRRYLREIIKYFSIQINLNLISTNSNQLNDSDEHKKEYEDEKKDLMANRFKISKFFNRFYYHSFSFIYISENEIAV